MAMQRAFLLLALALAAGCPPDEKSTTTDANTTGTNGTGTNGTGTTAGLTTTNVDPPPAGQCRDANDCDLEECVSPGTKACRGATGCLLEGTECVDDPSCGGTPEAPQLCVQDQCCGVSFCLPGCLADADCGLGQRCGADARCTGAKCDPKIPCPANFTCVEGACAVTGCTGDATCDGYCVNGLCGTAFGSCQANN